MNEDRVIHGEARRGKKTPLHSVWGAMIQRTTNPNNPHYKDYGERGILVCSEWRKFIHFRDWATSHGYAVGLEIDRINNNGNYEPENCHFTSHLQNLLNRRRREDWGIKKEALRWRVQITKNSIRYSLKSFLTLEEAINARDHFVNNYDEMKDKYKQYPKIFKT